jgi:hypothetical protein
MTTSEPTEMPEPPATLQEEADEPTQNAMDAQRDSVGDLPEPGDAGGHS